MIEGKGCQDSYWNIWRKDDQGIEPDGCALSLRLCAFPIAIAPLCR